MNKTHKADILIANNDCEEIRLFSQFLYQAGYQVRQAVDGEMALMAVENRTPDLVLLATHLFHLDGYQIAKTLKGNPKTEGIPLIFVDGFQKYSERVNLLKIGGSDYFFKPYQLEEILLRIEYHLKIAKKQQELEEENRLLKQKLYLYQILQPETANNEDQINLLKLAIAATHNGIVITDATHPDNPVIYANTGFEEMTGYSVEEVIGKNCRFLQGTDTQQSGILKFRQAIAEKQKCTVTLRNYRKDGSLFWNEISISPVRDRQGNVTHFIGVQTDVTERKRVEEERQRSQASVQQMNRELYNLNNQLHRLANLDGLTELANRRCFDERIEEEWRRCQREQVPLSVICGDIDYFKRYNDRYGHLVGDDCLKAVAKAISDTVNRAGDLVARTGGEEFTVLLPNTPLKGAMRVAQNIRDNIKQLQITHETSDVSYYVSMSLGVATMIPTEGQSFDDLKRFADEALYSAKDAGRDRAVPYCSNIETMITKG